MWQALRETAARTSFGKGRFHHVAGKDTVMFTWVRACLCEVTIPHGFAFCVLRGGKPCSPCGLLPWNFVTLPGLAQQGKLGRAAGVGFLSGSVGWLNTPIPATPSALPVGDIVTVGDIAKPCHP